MKQPLPTEYEMQVTVAEALSRFCTPGWVWTHFPAGEHRHPAVAARLKKMGLKPGWPDLLLISPNGVLHSMELKRDKGRLRPDQLDYRDVCRTRRLPWAVARSVDEALAQLRRWGALSARLTMLP